MGIYVNFPSVATDRSNTGASCASNSGGSLVDAINAVGFPFVIFSFPETGTGGSTAALRVGGFGFPPYNPALFYETPALVTFTVSNVSLGSGQNYSGMALVTRVRGADAHTYNIGFINNGTYNTFLTSDNAGDIFDPTFEVELRMASSLAGTAFNTANVDYITCREVSSTNKVDVYPSAGVNAGQTGYVGVWVNPGNVVGGWNDGTYAEYGWVPVTTGDTCMLWSSYAATSIPANATAVGYALSVLMKLRNGLGTVSGTVRCKFYAAIAAWNGNADTSPRTECVALDVTGSTNMTNTPTGVACGGQGILSFTGVAPVGSWVDYNGGCQPSIASLNAGSIVTLLRANANPGGNNQPIAGIDSAILTCWYDVPAGGSDGGALQHCEA